MEPDLGRGEEGKKEGGEGTELNDILKKYGVLEMNERKAVTMYDEFLSDSKHELKELYLGIFDNVKSIALEEASVARSAGLEANPGTEKDPQPGGRLDGETRNCERIMAEYLTEMAGKVSQRFFITLIIFTRLYKDGMNEYGWNILAKYKAVTAEERKEQFTKRNGAEHVPEACNDFLKAFMPRVYPNMEPIIAIDLTYHFCDWLYRKKYTHSKISRI